MKVLILIKKCFSMKSSVLSIFLLFSFQGYAKNLYFSCDTGEAIEVYLKKQYSHGIIYNQDDHSDLRILSCKTFNQNTATDILDLRCEGEYKAWNDDIQKDESIYLNFYSSTKGAFLDYIHLNSENDKETTVCRQIRK